MYPAATAAKSLQSCPTLCDPIDCSSQGSHIPGILQARTLEWVPFPSPMHECQCYSVDLSYPLLSPLCPQDQPLHLSVQFSSVAQSCLTLCDPMNCSTPGLPVHHHLPEFTPNNIHRVISSSVIPFLSCPQSLPASESFPMSQLFTSGGQSTGVSALASLLPKKSQG